MDIPKLCSVIVMVTPVTFEGKFQEDGDLIYAGEYQDIGGTPNGDYTKTVRVRRLICLVCKLKFRTSNLKIESSTILLLVEYIAWPIASSTFNFQLSFSSIAKECFLSTTIVVKGRPLDELYGLILLIDIFSFCASSFLASFLINSFMGANTVTITPRDAASRINWSLPASNILLNPFSAEKSIRISL
jgi:hypothetical protein